MSKAHSTSLTQSLVRELLDYCPDTGVLTWKPRTEANGGPKFRNWNSKWAGKEAGSVRKDSTVIGLYYRYVRFFGRLHPAHRVIWVWMTGICPDTHIDHISGDGLDNKWKNLREVTNRENLRNARIYRNNQSGVTGVNWRKDTSKWRVYTTVETRHLGQYQTLAEAVSVRKAAELRYEYHPNHGDRKR